MTPWLLPAALAGLGLLGWACQDTSPEGLDGSASDGATSQDEGGTTSEGEVSRGDVLASIADNVLVPATADFATSADALEVAARAYADAVASDPDSLEDSLAAAQQAWRDTMMQWQALEVMQLGPATSSLVGIGGQDLRDSIYSWPTVDTCSVDRALAEAAFEEDDFFATQLVWAHGLDALEYLLFVHEPDHTCPSQVQLDGPWAALTFEEIELRRAHYAAVVAAGVFQQAMNLASSWSSEGGDFASALANPAAGGSPYSSEAEALDEVFRAMFYVDIQTKDGKLGLPLGLIEGCPAVPCSNLMEAPFSGDSAASIVANLRGLQRMIQGGSDPETADGFDDLLDAMGEGQIANTLLAQIETAIEVAEGFEDPLQLTIASDPEHVIELYAAVKAATDTLKGPFVMALMLTVPAEGAGDND